MRPGREIDGTLRLYAMWPGLALLVTVNADGSVAVWSPSVTTRS
jgi:hypothetical protein